MKKLFQSKVLNASIHLYSSKSQRLVMKRIVIFFICCTFIFISGNLQAKEQLLHLVINEKGTSKTFYQIAIPENFVLGYKQPSKELFLEFIPKGEKIDNWSEIITVMQIPFYRGKIYTFLAGIKNGFDSSDKNSILQSKISMQTEKEIQTGEYIFDGPHASPMTYMIPCKAENEIVFMIAAKATNDLWNIQYAIKYPKKLSKEKKAILMQKVQAFRDNCVIIKGNYKELP